MKHSKESFTNKAKRLVLESGLDYSWKKYALFVLFYLAGLLCICVVYRLELIYLAIVELIGICSVPPLIMYYYMAKSEFKRFNDVDVYLHQMAYSFQRNPKINVALSDTVKVTNGHIKEVIYKAILELECSDNRDIYEEALAIIEDEYPCPRMKTLHRFLINIEKHGGDYYNSLQILIDDFDRWVKRVYKYQKDINHVKNNSVIGIILGGCISTASLIISSIMGNSSEISMDITGDRLYQAVSAIFIILNVLYFLLMQVQCNKDWLEGERNEKSILRDYKLVFHKKSKILNIFTGVLLGIGVALSLISGIFISPVAGLVCVGVTIYLFLVPKINRKSAFSRLREDIYVSFSDWLRDVVINLHHMPLLASIESTYDQCSFIMKDSLETFIYELEKDPLDVTPYYTFMEEYGVLDISSSVKSLYSVSELESENADKMLNELIRRNYEMVDKHEKISNQDTISIMKFSEYIPMIFVAIKLAMDMLLIISNYL